MTQTQLRNFMQNAKTSEKTVDNLIQLKCQEYMVAQANLKSELEAMMAKFFPSELETLIEEYINDQRQILSFGDLWIKRAPSGGVIAMLDPNLYTTVTISNIAYHNANILTYHPVGLDSLKRYFEILNEYIVLKNQLSSKIALIYDKLATWKEKKINSEMVALNSMQFNTSVEEFPKYEVTILIEEIV